MYRHDMLGTPGLPRLGFQAFSDTSSIALDPDRLRDTVLRAVSVREEGTGGALKEGETYI